MWTPWDLLPRGGQPTASGQIAHVHNCAGMKIARLPCNIRMHPREKALRIGSIYRVVSGPPTSR